MPANDSLETFRRVLYVLEHSEFHIAVAYNIGIGLVLLLALESTLLMLKTRLVEVDVLTHDYRLDGD